MPAEFDPSLWPLPPRVWLYRAGLSNARIQELGFYWNAGMRRVVMPVLEGAKLVYWQARGFDSNRPKYINPPVDKPLYKLGTGKILVVTEDMISAARVGEVTEAWSILGTSVDDAKISALVRRGLPIRVWLDPDKAGLKGRRKLVPRLRAYGVDAVAIKADRDPKLYSKEEIMKYLLI
jgi:DNA primase